MFGGHSRSEMVPFAPGLESGRRPIAYGYSLGFGLDGAVLESAELSAASVTRTFGSNWVGNYDGAKWVGKQDIVTARRPEHAFREV